MICENCKRIDATLILIPESKGQIRWQKFLCSACYIDLTGMRGEYKKWCDKEK
jgi:protein-arginine kinase activator protein McsA